MRVSIGIPVYNGESFLDKAINSVLFQSFKDFELILLNDGSTDSTLKIMQHYEKVDNRIRVINDGQKKGIVFRLNQLVEESKGEFYARMDADDIMFPERIKIQQEILLKNPEIDVVHSSAISINSKNEILGIKENKDYYNNPTKIIHPSVMGRKNFFLKNRYKEGYCQMEDLELWERTISKYNFKYIDDPLLFYREDSTKISLKHKKMFKGLKFFCKSYEIHGFRKFKILVLSKIKFYIFFLMESVFLEKLILNFRYKKLNEKYQSTYNQKLKEIINGRI